MTWVLLALLTLEVVAVIRCHSRRTCGCGACRAYRDQHLAKADREAPRHYHLDRWH